MAHIQRDFRLDIKSVSEAEGTFVGQASVYGLADLVGDVVEKGAFSKTLQERPSVPLLWMHDSPVGVCVMEDTGNGLTVKGKLSLGIERARDALVLMKDGAVTGLSIGYKAIKSTKVDGLRHLKEVAVFEISLVPVPALPEAQITSVKKVDVMERKMDFAEALDNVQTWSAQYTYADALRTALSDLMRDETLSTDECMAQIGASCDQFKTSMVELCPKLRTLMNATYGYDFKKLLDIEQKAGRKISAASRSKIEDAVKQLQALLEDETAAESDTGKSAMPPETKAAPTEGAATKSTEPVDHSKLSSQIEGMKGILTWN